MKRREFVQVVGAVSASGLIAGCDPKALDMSISYMGIINPSLDPNNDYASAFSLRFVTSF